MSGVLSSPGPLHPGLDVLDPLGDEIGLGALYYTCQWLGGFSMFWNLGTCRKHYFIMMFNSVESTDRSLNPPPVIGLNPDTIVL